jgi:hypothetical protein
MEKRGREESDAQSQSSVGVVTSPVIGYGRAVPDSLVVAAAPWAVAQLNANFTKTQGAILLFPRFYRRSFKMSMLVVRYGSGFKT